MSDARRYEFADPDLAWPADAPIPYALFVRAEFHDEEVRSLHAEVKGVLDALWEFAGATAWQKAQNAMERMDYLKRELSISQYNESAAHHVAEQERKERDEWKALAMSLRSKMRYARIMMEANDPNNARFLFGPPQGDDHEQARQTAGTEGQE